LASANSGRKRNLLNWSILVGRGKENNRHALSNGEWKGWRANRTAVVI